jgi:hypothetical protein
MRAESRNHTPKTCPGGGRGKEGKRKTHLRRFAEKV